jgi:Beta-propeller repeat
MFAAHERMHRAGLCHARSFPERSSAARLCDFLSGHRPRTRDQPDQRPSLSYRHNRLRPSDDIQRIQPDLRANSCAKGAAHLSILDPSQSGSGGLVYSTFLAGNETGKGETGYGVAVDSAGKAYLVGGAGDGGFLVTTNAYDSTCPGTTSNGCEATFISVIDPTQSGTNSLVYSTYFGGTTADLATSIAVDSNDNIYVAGLSQSTDLPTTTGAYQGQLPARLERDRMPLLRIEVRHHAVARKSARLFHLCRRHDGGAREWRRRGACTRSEQQRYRWRPVGIHEFSNPQRTANQLY